MPTRKPQSTPRRLAFGRARQERSGRWSAAYLHHGVLHRAVATFPTKQAATSWLDGEQHLIELDRRTPGTWTPPAERATKAAAARLTLRGYAKPWLEQRNISRRTRENYRYHLESNILPTLGDHALTKITPEDVRVWFSGLGTDYPTRNARAYGVLTAVLNTAVDDGLIDRSPARIKGGTAVKHTKRSVVLLEPGELAALAEAMPAELRLTVLLAGWCGLRRGEVFGLTREDIGTGCATVRINKAVVYREHTYTCGPTKTRESNRTVTVPIHLRPVIESHLREHTGKAKSALLFPDPETGSFYTEGRFRGPFFAARKAIDKEGLHFHDLRHFGGVMAAVAGATTKEVMDRLGHTTSTAAMRYQHVAAGRTDALAERLSALAAPKTP
ncbi:tyrosine-type recombinase/integrase [Mycolicibacterium holsaticum]|uniref:tyrosine-type recombinase/integrase n=1 Tax=Mycolicibacterium holsaticum TaxID=152142 RepID=UPI001C7CC730|nr:site-specific integrase [Mycolicibacterium holsaticum]MDA4108155.1 integrase [Mycolicibacterium holsaticum DSM 44478 = JCM 12374]QZA14435.1 site-specific integrase [Mycolicibacterium holsaticum DSM 44478 = JCM 12374]UNC08115.1 site-specific integrase [Mycolicibacterium holsaticum DSM 44478 = JCM 12374]